MPASPAVAVCPGEHEVTVAVTGLWAGPDAPRALDAPLTDVRPEPAQWLAAQGPVARRGLWGRLESQLLLGERVLVHDVEGGWARVSAVAQPAPSREARGYPGFVPAHHLRPAAGSVGGRRVVVHRPAATVHEAPRGAVLVADVSLGTVLPVGGPDPDGGWAAVRLPGGRTGWLPGPDLEPVRSAGMLPTGEELVAAGRSLLGAGYVAGGLHSSALDCSGLVHALYRRFGVVVPRDAADQLAMGTAVPPGQAAYGDLVFFTDPGRGAVYHVGVCTGFPRVLHASQADWAVVEAPLTPVRRAHLSHARRLRHPAGGAPVPPGRGSR